jgi:hypothetical protein
MFRLVGETRSCFQPGRLADEIWLRCCKQAPPGQRAFVNESDPDRRRSTQQVDREHGSAEAASNNYDIELRIVHG